MKVVVTGAGGMLAGAVIEDLALRGHQTAALTRAALDILDAATVTAVMEDVRPDAVIQCAAFKAVDDAETQPDQAFRVNAEGTRIVAKACKAVGAVLVYPSTDYVFPGDSKVPYRPKDATGPLNVYGRSKLEGERAAMEAGRTLILRTSWLYGHGGPNFVETMLRLAEERDVLNVVDDQKGRPTWTRTLAVATIDLLEREVEGIFHVTDAGDPTTWYGFAEAILAFTRSDGKQARLLPTDTASFPRPAARPGYSVLDLGETEARLGRRLPDWRASLGEYLAGRGTARSGD